MEVCARKLHVAGQLEVVTLTCFSFLSVSLADSGPAMANAPIGTVRTLACADSYGVGDAAVPASVLSLGGVEFNGLSRNGSEPLEQLSSRRFWYKAFIDIPKTSHRNILVSVRPLTTGSRHELGDAERLRAFYVQHEDIAASKYPSYRRVRGHCWVSWRLCYDAAVVRSPIGE